MSIPAPPNYTSTRWIMIAVAVSLVCVFMWQIRSILLYGLAAVMLVILITIPVGMLAKIGVGRIPAIIITIVGGVFLTVVLVLMVLPTLVEQFVILGEQITKGLEQIVQQWNSGEIQEKFPFLRDLELIDLQEMQIDIQTVRDVLQQGFDTLASVSGSVLPFIGGIANTFLSLLIVFFLTMFFLAEPETYKNGFIQLFPLWYRHRVRYILERLNNLLRRWIFGQVIGMTVTGVGTFLGLSLIGIQQAAALAVMTAFFSFVPNFGELISVCVALAVGAVQAPDRLVWIIIVIYGVSFLQGQMIGPLIASESVDIPPVVILLGQIVVARFFGVLGIILAVPIMVIMMVLVQEIYVRDILGDRGESKMPAKVADDDSVVMIDHRDDSLISDGV